MPALMVDRVWRMRHHHHVHTQPGLTSADRQHGIHSGADRGLGGLSGR